MNLYKNEDPPAISQLSKPVKLVPISISMNLNDELQGFSFRRHNIMFENPSQWRTKIFFSKVLFQIINQFFELYRPSFSGN